MNFFRLTARLVAILLLLTILVCHQEAPVSAQIESGNTGGVRSLFDALLSPLRHSLRHARQLLGQPVDGVNDFVQHNFDQLQAQAFKMFMQMYNKTYSPSELPKRMALFLERRKAIEESVRAFSEGKVPFMMRENAYVDWDEQELKALTGVSPPQNVHELTPEERELIQSRQLAPADNFDTANKIDGDDTITIDVEPTVMKSRAMAPIEGNQDEHRMGEEEIDDAEGASIIMDSPSEETESTEELDDDNMIVRAPVSLPAHKDWRKSGCVATPIDQEKCGCCYAIATMGVLESMRCINQVSSPILAPQQIIDCSTPRAGYQNFGCDGGWPTRVLKYLQDVGVASRDTCYPFVKRQEACKLAKVKPVSGCSVPASVGNSRLKYKVLNNERDILYHVANTGPVVTVMKATDRFLYYGSGIFDDRSCSRSSQDVDHAISIVGYGRENGQDYWLIKNSWGTSWGQGGYGKYRRGSNTCSIGHWGWVMFN